MLVVLLALLLAPELVPAGRHRQEEAGGGRRKRWERGTEAQHTPPTEPDVRPVTQLTTGSLHL